MPLIREQFVLADGTVGHVEGSRRAVDAFLAEERNRLSANVGHQAGAPKELLPIKITRYKPVLNVPRAEPARTANEEEPLLLPVMNFGPSPRMPSKGREGEAGETPTPGSRNTGDGISGGEEPLPLPEMRF